MRTMHAFRCSPWCVPGAIMFSLRVTFHQVKWTQRSVLPARESSSRRSWVSIWVLPLAWTQMICSTTRISTTPVELGVTEAKLLRAQALATTWWVVFNQWFSTFLFFKYYFEYLHRKLILCKGLKQIVEIQAGLFLILTLPPLVFECLHETGILWFMKVVFEMKLCVFSRRHINIFLWDCKTWGALLITMGNNAGFCVYLETVKHLTYLHEKPSCDFGFLKLLLYFVIIIHYSAE